MGRPVLWLVVIKQKRAILEAVEASIQKKPLTDDSHRGYGEVQYKRQLEQGAMQTVKHTGEHNSARHRCLVCSCRGTLHRSVQCANLRRVAMGVSMEHLEVTFAPREIHNKFEIELRVKGKTGESVGRLVLCLRNCKFPGFESIQVFRRSVGQGDDSAVHPVFFLIACFICRKIG